MLYWQEGVRLQECMAYIGEGEPEFHDGMLSSGDPG